MLAAHRCALAAMHYIAIRLRSAVLCRCASPCFESDASGMSYRLRDARDAKKHPLSWASGCKTLARQALRRPDFGSTHSSAHTLLVVVVKRRPLSINAQRSATAESLKDTTQCLHSTQPVVHTTVPSRRQTTSRPLRCSPSGHSGDRGPPTPAASQQL